MVVLAIACFLPAAACGYPRPQGDSEGLAKRDDDRNRKLLQEVVDALQKQLPLSMGMIGELTAFQIVGDTLRLETRIDETMFNLDALGQNPELMHENIMSMISNSSNPSMKMFVSLLEKAGMSMKITYVGNSTGKRVTATMSNGDIKKGMKNGAKKDPNAIIDRQLEIMNVQLPMDYGNGMTAQKVVREGDYIVYYFECNETLLSIDTMEKNRSTMTATIQQQLRSNSPDPSIKELVRMCTDAYVGIIYKYVGATSGKVMEVRIEVDEMQ